MTRSAKSGRNWTRRLAEYVKRNWGVIADTGRARVGLCSVLVGVVSGLGAVAFTHLLKFMYVFVLGGLLHFHAPPTGEESARAVSYPGPGWLLVLIPTIGGLISGLIVFSLAPEAEGHGTDALIRAFHRNAGRIRARVPLIKGISSIITIGTGGSAGQEGPIAQIGAGFGSNLAGMLKLTTHERRLLMMAGASGGIGAIFRAPLGGAIFGMEVLYSTSATESDALLPCLISSITAYTTFALFITPKPIFIIPPLAFRGLHELPFFAALALLCAIVGFIYIKTFYGMRDYVFHKIPVPRHVKPAIGGFLVGLLALRFPQLLSGGYGWVQWGAIGEPPNLTVDGDSPFSPHMHMNTLLLLALLKIVATSLTISSGGSGGVFGPSIFIGGMLGGAFGRMLERIFHGTGIEPSAFVLVGMGGFFAGVSKTPLTSMVMVCEMSGSYSLLVPLMFVCAVHMALSRPWTIYEEQVPSPIDSPAHQGDFIVDLLERIHVSETTVRSTGLEIVAENAPFARLVERVAGSTETLFPVVDEQGRLTGIFSLRDLRPALLGAEWGPLVLATDLATRPVISVTPDDDLHTALRRMTVLNSDEIPVVRRDDSASLIGLLSRRDLVSAYLLRIAAFRVEGSENESKNEHSIKF